MSSDTFSTGITFKVIQDFFDVDDSEKEILVDYVQNSNEQMLSLNPTLEHLKKYDIKKPPNFYYITPEKYYFALGYISCLPKNIHDYGNKYLPSYVTVQFFSCGVMECEITHSVYWLPNILYCILKNTTNQKPTGEETIPFDKPIIE